MAIRILIADDHRLIRRGVRGMLDRKDDFEIVGEAPNGRDAVRLAAELKPDVVLMDLSMPDLNGVDATRRITEEDPGVRVVILSMHLEGPLVRDVVLAGAVGYLLKDTSGEDLQAAVRAAAAGEYWFAPEVAEAVAGLPESAGGAAASLSSREREVLQLFAEGHGTKEIAFSLGLSAKTVEAHRQNISRKLGLRSLAEFARYAIREGLSPL
jgi:DNA-binding NarL/FixJ family response regulator